MAMPHAKPAPNPQTALLISPVDEDHAFLQALFGIQGWTLVSVRSLERAAALVRENIVPVIVVERDLFPGTWRDVLGMTCRLPNPPLVIVTSLHADEFLWAEALNLGAHDVIAKPLNKLELIRVLDSAWIRSRRIPPTRTRAASQ